MSIMEHLWSEDGYLKDTSVTEYLRWYPEFNAFFIDRLTKTVAEVVTTTELAKRINDGTYDTGDRGQNREGDGTGLYLVMDQQPIPTTAPQVEPLPPGMFRIIVSNQLGVGLQPYVPNFDQYIDLQTHTVDIQTDLETFLKKEPEYRKLGLLYRRGLLLYGPAGTGKSVLIEHMCAKYRDNIRVLIVPPGFSIRYLNELRGLLKDRVTFFIFEELTTVIADSSEVSALLNFLDGTNSWDRSVVIATTNFPELLPGNIVDRPSRFDRLYKIDYPTEAVRRIYLEAKLGKEAVTDELIKATKGYSIAHLRELVVSIPIYGLDPHARLKEIEEIKRKVQREFADGKGEIGF